MIKEKIFLTVEEITPSSFAPFGSIIDRKLVFGSNNNDNRGSSKKVTSSSSSPSRLPLPPKASWANQGSAIKFGDVSYLTNFYEHSSETTAERNSGVTTSDEKKARPVMTLFVCSPRKLQQYNIDGNGQQRHIENEKVHISYSHALNAAQAGPSENEPTDGSKSRWHYLDLDVLERHPYTSQTFIPMGLRPRNGSTVYLVIVAPTLPGFDSPSGSSSSNSARRRQNQREPEMSPVGPPTADSPHYQRKGSGQPDLEHVRAFIVDGDTAVTYAAGTWHAPMIVLGTESVDFVVAQFANGVPHDDCQEVDITGAKITVQVAAPAATDVQNKRSWKPML